MNKLFQILHSKKGSSLVIVIVVFAVVMVLGTAILTVASYSYNNSIYYHNQQQAEFTARSVMDTVMAQLNDTSTCAKISEKLQTAVGGVYPTLTAEVNGVTVDSSTDNTMGKAEVKMQYIHNADPKKVRVKVSVVATVKDVAARVDVFLKKGKGSRMNPMDFILFSDTTVTFNGDKTKRTKVQGNTYQLGGILPINTEFKGHVLSRSSFDMNDTMYPESEIYGNIITDGSVAISSGRVIGNAYYFGTITGQTRISGTKTLVATGADTGFTADLPNDLRILGASYVLNNSSTASYDFQNGDSFFPTGVPAGPTLKSNDGYEITEYVGSCSYKTTPLGAIIPINMGQTPLPNGIMVYRSAAATYVKMNDGHVFDLKNHKLFLVDTSATINWTTFTPTSSIVKSIVDFTSATPTVTVPMNPFIINIDLDDVTIQFNGNTMLNSSIPPLDSIELASLYDSSTGAYIIRQDYALNTGDLLKDKKIVFDTTTAGKDIYLYVKSNTLELGENAIMSITGDRDVYIFLEKGSDTIAPTVTAGQGCTIGDADGGTNSPVQFYFIGTEAKVDLQKNATFHGIAYLPQGNYSETVGVTGITKVIGSIMAKNISITRGNTYIHVDMKNETMLNATMLQSKYGVIPKINANQIDWKLDYYGK